jgi:hypothetical protein
MAGRDEFGVLTGRLEPGGGAEPIIVLSDIVPIAYPCTRCGDNTLHVVGEQAYGPGVGLRVPLMRRSLISWHACKGYHLICSTCIFVARHLSKDSVVKLRDRTIPEELCQVYRVAGGSPQPYTEGYADSILSQAGAGYSQRQLAFIRTCLSVYRREDH